AQAEQKAATGPQSQSPVVPAPQDVVDERLDVSAMNDQTRHLIRSLLCVGIIVGLWGVWVDVLPALAILKKVEIQALTIERVIEEPVQTIAKAPSPEGGTIPTAPADETATETPPETKQRTINVPITLADLMLSLIILIVAIGAARNLPGMLEMMVLQRLPIDNAARYAITTLAQYAFMIFGVSAAFYVVGLRWQNVQWLAAALMVGLGFGLQEIFANFFSGLIVLLERPVRVGDIVTVGNTTGIVTRIRMRASTITNWERQEMIIPNKDLITGTVLNWTLSDTVQRVFIQVGVAYGSDTDKATETLYNVLKSHPNVLADPPPLVTFAGFGDSTLNFELRCFLPTAAVKLATTHELHTNIDKAFRKAGIEIAFPQCDLHIRSVEGAIPLEQVSHSTNGLTGNGHRSSDTSLSKGA
ncbi:MAG: mechanosensitive ion channel, partial [Planctomycetaceae bacterium]|nr:mechanosensitive ion channel [Planctomycetaceae bacterium]